MDFPPLTLHNIFFGGVGVFPSFSCIWGNFIEDGSGFDTLVDDEDFVQRGPPVFTNTDHEEHEDEVDADQKITTKNDTEDFVKQKQQNNTANVLKIIPESIVLENATHGNLNGRFLISNSGGGTVIDLYFNETPQDDAEKINDDENGDKSQFGDFYNQSSRLKTKNKTLIMIFIILFKHLFH